MRLNDETTVALAKAIKKAVVDESRDRLEVGEYHIDSTIRIYGTFKVHPDEDYIPTVHLPVIGVMALMARYCGVTRQAAKQAIERIAREAHENFELVNDVIARQGEWVDDMIQGIKSMTQELPKKTKRGKVTTNLKCEAA